LVKARGYFYFERGEADDWLDKTVSVPTVSSLNLAGWRAEYERLKKLNTQIMDGTSRKPVSKRKQQGNP
jgi:hypothetical protein